MKRLGNLWPAVTTFENLYLAWRKARRGKADRASVIAFELNLEGELFALQRALLDGSYRPGEYRLFTVYERKPRRIAAAPFRDRVVHHALMNIIEPPLDRSFIHDSYACRVGKGAHRAVRRYQQWAQRYAYVLKMDVRRYFPSIDRQLLQEKLRRRIKDRCVLKLLDRIIETGPVPDEPPALFPGDDLLTPLERPRGIPIGNLTSQFFANLYLDAFDHWIKQEVSAVAYLRYVDDMAVLSNDSGWLRELRERTRDRLAGERLWLHPCKAEISRTRDGLDLLGYRVFPDFIRLRNDNGRRFARRLHRLARGYATGRLDWPDVHCRVMSWLGHAAFAETRGLRKAIFGRIVFRRGAGQSAASW